MTSKQNAFITYCIVVFDVVLLAATVRGAADLGAMLARAL